MIKRRKIPLSRNIGPFRGAFASAQAVAFRAVEARYPKCSGDERNPFMGDFLDPLIASTRPGSVPPVLVLLRRRGFTRGPLEISEAADSRLKMKPSSSGTSLANDRPFPKPASDVKMKEESRVDLFLRLLEFQGNICFSRPSMRAVYIL